MPERSISGSGFHVTRRTFATELLNNIFVRNTVPSVVTLEKICSGLKISLAQFFEEDTPASGFLDILSDDDERDIIAMYRKLDKNSKGLLKAYLMGLNKQLP